MADEKQDRMREAIGVYEKATGKKYDAGIAGGKSREAYKAWAGSPAGKSAWKAHTASKPKKPAAAAEAKPAAGAEPSPTPKKPTKPRVEGQTGTAGAGAISRTQTAGERKTVAGRAERRKQEAADKATREAERREGLQGGPKAEPIIEEGAGMGGAQAAQAEARKKGKNK